MDVARPLARLLESLCSLVAPSVTVVCSTALFHFAHSRAQLRSFASPSYSQLRPFTSRAQSLRSLTRSWEREALIKQKHPLHFLPITPGGATSGIADESMEVTNETTATLPAALHVGEKEVVDGLFESDAEVRQAQIVIDWLESLEKDKMDDYYEKVMRSLSLPL